MRRVSLSRMSASAGSAVQPAATMKTWFDRIRFCLAAGLVFAALHYVVDGFLLGRGDDRPTLIAPVANGWLAAPLVALIIWGAAILARKLTSDQAPFEAIIAICVGLALWSLTGGTSDAWLIQTQPNPGPPGSRPYLLLLVEYGYWAIVLAGLVRLAQIPTSAPTSGTRVTLGQLWPRTLAGVPVVAGISALLLSTAVALVLLCILFGPPINNTRHGQVIFATAVAFAVSTTVARKVTEVQSPIFYWPAPLLVGLIGCLVAAVNPALLIPTTHQQLDSLPAWGVTRPLPVQMISIGMIAVLVTLRTSTATATNSPSAVQSAS